MRLHIDDFNGPDALKAELCRHAIIMLDGRRQWGVIMADEEKGEVLKYIQQDDPRFPSELAKQGNRDWPTETVYGRVVIKDSRDEYKPAPLTGFAGTAGSL